VKDLGSFRDFKFTSLLENVDLPYGLTTDLFGDTFKIGNLKFEIGDEIKSSIDLTLLEFFTNIGSLRIDLANTLFDSTVNDQSVLTDERFENFSQQESIDNANSHGIWDTMQARNGDLVLQGDWNKIFTYEVKTDTSHILTLTDFELTAIFNDIISKPSGLPNGAEILQVSIGSYVSKKFKLTTILKMSSADFVNLGGTEMFIGLPEWLYITVVNEVTCESTGLSATTLSIVINNVHQGISSMLLNSPVGEDGAIGESIGDSVGEMFTTLINNLGSVDSVNGNSITIITRTAFTIN
jgi:hypothetical protein